MKKFLLVCLFLSLILCGCINPNVSEEPQTTTPPDTSDVFDQIALDAAEARADYYQNLVVELQKEIVSIKEGLKNALEKEGYKV